MKLVRPYKLLFRLLVVGEVGWHDLVTVSKESPDWQS